MNSTEWRKIARRTAITLVGVVCLTMLTGCPWDDDDDDIKIPTIWEITYWGDEAGTVVTPPVSWDNLNDVASYSESIAGYTITVTKPMPGEIMIVIDADDPMDLFRLVLDGDIAPDGQSAAGDYLGDGGEVGGWDIFAK